MPAKRLISERSNKWSSGETKYCKTLKVGNLTCKIIMAPYILGNSSRTIPTHE